MAIKRVSSTRKASTKAPSKASIVRRDKMAEELRQSVVAALLQHMQDEGISRSQLAAKLNVTEGRVAQILAGTENFTLASLAKMATALGKSFVVVLKDAA